MPSTDPVVKRYPGLVVRAARVGVGLHADRAFARGATISAISGRVYHWRVLWRRGGVFLANCFRYGDDTYLDPGDGPGRWLNHRCEPSAGIRKRGRRLELFAARHIRRGGEITLDYSTITGDDDLFRMRCHCGARTCRRWVARFGLLPPALRASYLRRGLVPPFLLSALD